MSHSHKRPRILRRCVWNFNLGLVLASLALLGPEAHAQESSGVRQLAQAYVSAIRSQDATGVEALWHPSSRACMGQADRAVVDRIIANELRAGGRIGTDYRIDIKPFHPTGSGSSRFFKFPAPPTRTLEIVGGSFAKSGLNFETVIMFLAQDDGAWFIDMPCPTPDVARVIMRH